MKRARRSIAAFTLPVRPQHRKELSVTGQKRKHLRKSTRKSSPWQLETTHSFIIAIETISFSEYYPDNNSKKPR